MDFPYHTHLPKHARQTDSQRRSTSCRRKSLSPTFDDPPSPSTSPRSSPRMPPRPSGSILTRKNWLIRINSHPLDPLPIPVSPGRETKSPFVPPPLKRTQRIVFVPESQLGLMVGQRKARRLVTEDLNDICLHRPKKVSFSTTEEIIGTQEAYDSDNESTSTLADDKDDDETWYDCNEDLVECQNNWMYNQNAIAEMADLEKRKYERLCNGKNINGRSVNGRRAINGGMMKGKNTSAERVNGERVNGERMNGKSVNGKRVNGESLKIGSIDSENVNGEGLKIESINTESVNGESLNGESEEGTVDWFTQKIFGWFTGQKRRLNDENECDDGSAKKVCRRGNGYIFDADQQ
ncbi:3150_t:CDS:1 [Paraglomus occultum]|uniref:3150_t:CDS:1 n=1 Tax=Paraglomus occultum TaxID=144539 RepID=A0A9N8ZUY0_9GLOM|nr:3150_t:CDS:1 [Paraglomus occultum]